MPVVYDAYITCSVYIDEIICIHAHHLALYSDERLNAAVIEYNKAALIHRRGHNTHYNNAAKSYSARRCIKIRYARPYRANWNIR